MTIDISQFFQVFFDEAEELLAEKERLLLAVDIAAPDAEDLNAIPHRPSIKGGASTFGLSDMSEVTHILESLLDRIRQGQMALTGGTRRCLFGRQGHPQDAARRPSSGQRRRPGCRGQCAHDAAVVLAGRARGCAHARRASVPYG